MGRGMRLFHRVEAGAAWTAALLFVLAGLLITYEVVARYIFAAPTIWAAEISQLCLIWGGLLAMARVLSTGSHIRVTALTDRLPRRARLAAEAVAMTVIAAFSGVTLWYGFAIFHDSFARGRTSGSMLNLPSALSEAAVPLGFALLAVAALAGLIRALRGRLAPDGGGGHGPE